MTGLYQAQDDSLLNSTIISPQPAREELYGQSRSK